MIFAVDADRDGIQWLFPSGPAGKRMMLLIQILGIGILFLLCTIIVLIVYDQFAKPAGVRIHGLHSSKFIFIPLPLFVTGYSMVMWIYHFAFACRREQVETEFHSGRAHSARAEIERVAPVGHGSRVYKICLECEIETHVGPQTVRPMISTVSFASESLAKAYLQKIGFPTPMVSFNPDDPREAFILPWDERQDNVYLMAGLISSLLAVLFILLSLHELRAFLGIAH